MKGGWLSQKSIKKNVRTDNIEIGKNCKIAKHVYLDKHGILKIGDNVTITSWVKILNHDASDILTGKKHSEITEIKDNAWIGLCSIILTGITIGKNSIIGAGSVVTKDVPDREIWAGNPAKKIGIVQEE